MTIALEPHRAGKGSLADRAEAALAAVVAAKGGHPRPGQVQMCREIASAIVRGEVMLGQAGTGTGKTLAYLTPAILSEGRTIVATHTKALQDQLLTDLELLAGVLHEAGFVRRRPTFAVLKGRRAYACLAKVTGEYDASRRRGAEAEGQPELVASSSPPSDTGLGLTETAMQVLSLRQWAEDDAVTGEQSEVPFPHTAAAWDQVSVGSDDCLGSACPFVGKCYSDQARQNAAQADIIVVNQALLAARFKVPLAVPIQDVQTVVIDEAHEFENVVANSLGSSVSVERIRNFVTRWDGYLQESDAKDRVRTRINTAVTELQQVLPTPPSPDRSLLGSADVQHALGLLVGALGAAEGLVQANKDPEDPSWVLINQAAANLLADLELIAQGNTDTFVTWLDSVRGKPVMRAALFDVAPVLHESLLSVFGCTVLVSATLTVARSFAIPARRLGLTLLRDGRAAPGNGVRVVDAASPFDYRSQARIWLPAGMPAPSSPQYPAELATLVAKVIAAAGGRTLALFTSWRTLNEVHERLSQRLPDVRFLVQQPRASTGQLARQFAQDSRSVLLGTRSFMTGISVEGDSCIAVVMDKLPFPSPADPILAARSDTVDRAGGSGFREVSLAEACLTTAQAAGRLIRTIGDRGVFVMADPRVGPDGASYAKAIIRSLPPAPVLTEEEPALAFLKAIAADADRRMPARPSSAPSPVSPADFDVEAW